MGRTVVFRTFRAFRASLLKKYAKQIERIRKARTKKKVDFRRQNHGFVAIFVNRRTILKRKKNSVIEPVLDPTPVIAPVLDPTPVIEPVLDPTPTSNKIPEPNPCTCSSWQTRLSGSSASVTAPSTSAAKVVWPQSVSGIHGSFHQRQHPLSQFPAAGGHLIKSEQGFHDLLARYNMISAVESLRRDPLLRGIFHKEPQPGPSRKWWNRGGGASSSSVCDMKELKEVEKIGILKTLQNLKEEPNEGDEDSKTEEMECQLQEPMTPETPAFSPLSVKSCDGLEVREEEPNLNAKKEDGHDWKEDVGEEKNRKWFATKVKDEPEEVDIKLNGKCGESSSGGKKGGGGWGGEDDDNNQFEGTRLIPVGVIRLEFKRTVKEEGSTGKDGKVELGDTKKGIRKKMRGTFEVTGAYSGTVAVPRDAHLTDPFDQTMRSIGESSILQMNPNAFVVGQDHFVMKAVARAVAEGRLPTGNRKLTGVTHKSPVLGELVVTASADDEEDMNADGDQMDPDEEKCDKAGDESVDMINGTVKIEKDE